VRRRDALAGLAVLAAAGPVAAQTPGAGAARLPDPLGEMDVTLTDDRGRRVRPADLLGRPALVFFGFTHCPDICPTSMYTLAAALAEPGGYDVQPILVSLDPERDTPEVMGAYTQTGGFPGGLVGLTGTRAQVDAAKRSFHVYSAMAPIEGAPQDVYNVDHSSFLYVLDGQWRTRSIVNTVQATPQQVAQCIAAGLERAG